MKLTNLLQLTEQHRYIVVRHFGLSPMDLRMITCIYQPIIGAFAAALYHTLSSRLPADAVGRTEPAALAGLFIACGLEPNERGRKRLVEETSKLEATGLLRTYRSFDTMTEDNSYEFHLEQPLSPIEFFNVHHLWLLLKERLGDKAAEEIRRTFFFNEGLSAASEGIRREELSSPFYEVFRMNVPPGAEQSINEAAPAEESAAGVERAEEFGRNGFRTDELLRRFPRSSRNRRYVERIQKEPSLMAEINYHAGKYELTLKETVSLLDEEGMFTPEGRLDGQRFEVCASELFLRGNERVQERDRTRSKQAAAVTAASSYEQTTAETAASEPSGEREASRSYWLDVPEQFAGECDARQYNAMLANAPYTKVLKLFFQPAAVPGPVNEAFLGMSVNYKLPDEVINVLIHYIRTNDLDWTRGFLEAIAANVAGKRIRTFESAVVYFRKAAQIRSGASQERNAETPRKPGDARRGRTTKPVIPVVKKTETKDATQEDIQRILNMARQLNEDRNS